MIGLGWDNKGENGKMESYLRKLLKQNKKAEMNEGRSQYAYESLAEVEIKYLQN